MKKVSKYFIIGDNVKIITGKEKGTIGEILKIIKNKGLVIIKGVNIKKRHTRSKDAESSGQICQIEAPISASNIMLYIEKNKFCSRVGYKIQKNGTKLRILKKESGTIYKQ
nr:ribosomal protein L24 [Boldiaceae sp.]